MLDSGISDNQANIIWAGLRKKYGYKITEPYLRERLVNIKDLYDEFFTVEKINFKGKNNEDIEHSMAYCNDIVSFVDAVCAEKGINKEEYSQII